MVDGGACCYVADRCGCMTHSSSNTTQTLSGSSRYGGRVRGYRVRLMRLEPLLWIPNAEQPHGIRNP